jgi:hypothetical protein
LLCLLLPLAAKERRKPLPMNELSNPASPSYVPIPYPKNREELIQDVLYAFKKKYMPREGYYYSGFVSPFTEIAKDLCGINPQHRFGKIVKVKNRDYKFPHDFTWNILVENKDGTNVAVYCFHANGLYMGSCPISPSTAKNLLYSSQDVLKRLENFIGKPIDPKNVKQCERVVLDSFIYGDWLLPTWEVELKDGSIYYYGTAGDEVFQVTGTIPRPMDANGQYIPHYKYIPAGTDYYAFDSISDQIVLFKRLGEKK